MNTHPDSIQAAAEEIADNFKARAVALEHITTVLRKHFPPAPSDEAAVRERFEAWARTLPQNFSIDRWSTGDYYSDSLQLAWQAYLAASAPSPWQDISSAPKDGTEIMGWYWNAPNKCRFSKSSGYWHSTTCGEVCEPTHWMELPAPPHSLTEGQR